MVASLYAFLLRCLFSSISSQILLPPWCYPSTRSWKIKDQGQRTTRTHLSAWDGETGAEGRYRFSFSRSSPRLNACHSSPSRYSAGVPPASTSSGKHGTKGLHTSSHGTIPGLFSITLARWYPKSLEILSNFSINK